MLKEIAWWVYQWKKSGNTINSPPPPLNMWWQDGCHGRFPLKNFLNPNKHTLRGLVMLPLTNTSSRVGCQVVRKPVSHLPTWLSCLFKEKTKLIHEKVKGINHDFIFQISLFFYTYSYFCIFRDSSYALTYLPKQSCTKDIVSAREPNIGSLNLFLALHK